MSAFRRRPQELAIATFALEGRSATVTEEELRFSASDISQFVGQRLSRRELAAVAADSAGWPIALHFYLGHGMGDRPLRERTLSEGGSRLNCGPALPRRITISCWISHSLTGPNQV